MKNLFNDISQSEKNRILEMHSNKKNLIKESPDSNEMHNKAMSLLKSELEDSGITTPIKELIGDNFILSKEWKRYGGACECFNYVYLPEENFRQPMRVYHKNTFKPSDITETLVFDGQNLRIGFDGEIIY